MGTGIGSRNQNELGLDNVAGIANEPNLKVVDSGSPSLLNRAELFPISGNWLDRFVDHLGNERRCVVLKRGRERSGGLDAFIGLAWPGGESEELGRREIGIEDGIVRLKPNLLRIVRLKADLLGIVRLKPNLLRIVRLKADLLGIVRLA